MAIGYHTGQCRLGELVKTDDWVPPRDSHSEDLGWDLRTCASNTFSGDADAAGPGTTL